MSLLLAVSSVELSAQSQADGAKSMEESWSIDSIDPSDRQGLIEWAQAMCRGLDIEVAASGLNAEPTTAGVVAALTQTLPDGVREEVAEVCRRELARDQRNRDPIESSKHAN
jgi:hypothetical protein